MSQNGYYLLPAFCQRRWSLPKWAVRRNRSGRSHICQTRVALWHHFKTNLKSITFTRYCDYLPVSSGPLKVAKLGSPGELLSRRGRKLVRHDHIHVARYVAATVDPVEDFHFLDEDIGAIVDGYPGRILLQSGANSVVANVLRVPIDAGSRSSKVGILWGGHRPHRLQLNCVSCESNMIILTSENVAALTWWV